MVNLIYTIGHSNRSLEEFIGLLKKFNVEVIIDVRRFPTSSVVPHFKRGLLEIEVKKHGIEYIWLGSLLGGYRSGGYREFMKSKTFRRGLNELVEIAKFKRVAIMCSEKLWFKCHRRFIADELVKLGFKVIHIIDDGKVYEHRVKNV